MTTTKRVHENGKYEGTFRWGRNTQARVDVTLSKNDHGWFCDSVNGIEWNYPDPLDPRGGWGARVARPTPLAALRGFLAQWNANEPDEGGVETSADLLEIQPTNEED